MDTMGKEHSPNIASVSGPSATLPNPPVSVRPRSRYYVEKTRGRSTLPTTTSSDVLTDKEKFAPENPKSSGNCTATTLSSPGLSESTPIVSHEDIIPLCVPTDKTKSPWSKSKSSFSETPDVRKISDVSLGIIHEPEKLAWTGDMESATDAPEIAVKKEEKDDLFEARFDQSGTILQPDSRLPVSAGLHHHGQDPERPGYTLDEIFTLLQSSSHPQRLWALGALAAILHQAKLSLYDEYLEVSLLTKLSSEDMIFPLRHLLDHSSIPVVRASLKALEALLVNNVDEFMTDELLLIDKNPLFFELKPASFEDKENDADESELTDVQLMKTDVIKGFLRTAILKRFTYLMDVFQAEMDSSATSNLLTIMTRFVRHSSDVAQQVIDDEKFMIAIMSSSVSAKAPVYQMKFIRILTSILGPLPQMEWAERTYHAAAGWISSLRNVIDDTLVRDMVTESLNLLIVLGHYGVTPDSISGIEDVFPQVLHSAGPNPAGEISAWDAGCCSRILIFLSFCLQMSTIRRALISDQVALLVMQHVLTRNAYLTNLVGEEKDFVHQLKASYIFYATEYHRSQRLDSIRLMTVFLRQLAPVLPKLFDLSEIPTGKVARVSSADPLALPSYGIVEWGGQSVIPAFRMRQRLSVMIHAARFLNVTFLDCQQQLVTVALPFDKINTLLAVIPRIKPLETDFWASYYLRILVEIVKVAVLYRQAGMSINYGDLYRAGLHIIPFLGDHQAEDLKAVLTLIIFNPLFLSESSDLPVAHKPGSLNDMAAMQKVFSYLKPLGFSALTESPLVVPSRRQGVFTKTWIFDCYDYVLQWGNTCPLSRDHCIAGYFYWLVHIVKHVTLGKDAVMSSNEIYTYLGDFFNEDGDYRHEVVAVCIKGILRHLISLPAKKLTLKSDTIYKGKAVDDLYDALLDDYEASSYADEVFTNYILVPVQQRHPITFRQKFWGPEKQIFTVVRIHHLDLCYSVEEHLHPAEEDPNLLAQFFILLMTQTVTEQRTPLLFLICVHHLNHFLRRTAEEITDSLRKRILLFLRSNQEAELAKFMMTYSGPATEKTDRVLKLHSKMPDFWNDIL